MPRLGELWGGRLVEALPLPVVGIDLDGTVRVVNPPAEELTGYPADQLLGSHVRRLLPPTVDVEATIRDILIAEHGGRHRELHLVRADGSLVPVGISFAPHRWNGEVVGILGVGRDITARKRLEARLAQEAAGFRALADAADIGVYRLRVDAQGRTAELLHANRAFLAATDHSVDELRGDPATLDALLPEPAQRRLVANRQDPGAAVWPLEFPYAAPDGSTQWLSLFEVPIRDESGRVTAVQGVIRNVTRRQRQQAALGEALDLERRAADELRRVDELRRLFLQAVSHELRTPLTSVLGFAATLLDHGDQLLSEQRRHLAERIHVQGTKLHRLLEDLLDVERLSRGVVTLERRPTDVGELIHGVAEERQDPALHVTVHTPAAAEVDAAKVERIVTNLIDNARKHAGGDAVVRVDVRTAGPVLRLVVEDDGPGLPDELKARVFGLFEQGRAGQGSHVPGTGIGLTLVRELAMLHGGSCAVEDAAGGGARFVVELPLRATEPAGPR